MPNGPETPKQSPKNPNTDVDREEPGRELEDRVGRRTEEGPDMVPPGTVRRDKGLGKPGIDMEDDEALVADRDNARSSDLTDARDGVDNSDTLPRDPDAAGGKSPR